MTQVAYALRADSEDSFAGGVLNVGDEDFDVAAQLKKGDGYIVVETATGYGTTLAAVPDHYTPLKRVPVTQALKAVDEPDPPAKPARGRARTGTTVPADGVTREVQTDGEGN